MLTIISKKYNWEDIRIGDVFRGSDGDLYLKTYNYDHIDRETGYQHKPNETYDHNILSLKDFTSHFYETDGDGEEFYIVEVYPNPTLVLGSPQ